MIEEKKKRKNTRRKGNVKELIVQKVFEDDGFVCERARASCFSVKTPGKNSFFVKSNDFFGLFDIICKKKGHNTVWVQVGPVSNKTTKMKQIQEYPHIWNDSDTIELWLYCDRRVGREAHWEVWEYLKNGEWVCQNDFIKANLEDFKCEK
jgi:alpha-N-acetylglucosamine transferase